MVSAGGDFTTKFRGPHVSRGTPPGGSSMGTYEVNKANPPLSLKHLPSDLYLTLGTCLTPLEDSVCAVCEVRAPPKKTHP